MSARELILGIETSCDDTACAIVDREGNVLSSVIAAQGQIHTQHGGVFPELASRAHVESIGATVSQALRNANLEFSDLTAIAVTRGPGLIGSLLVGVNAANGLALATGLPVIGVNHLRGHLRSATLEGNAIEYPAIVLLVSGGHSMLARMRTPHDVEMLGTTRDDSVGEAYDKVGRMIGCGFPAGPAVDKMAARGKAIYDFPRPLIHDGLDFSFSGLKSSVSRFLAQNPDAAFDDVAASFVEACLDVLMAKCRRALEMELPKSLVIVGGVSASPQLRARAKELCDGLGVRLCLPPLKWSTDNAAMIAYSGFDYLDTDRRIKPVAISRLALSEW